MISPGGTKNGMQDVCSYYVEVLEKVDEKVFNATSPLQVTVIWANEQITLLTICSDQSGLIGLIRQFHRQGFVLLSVCRKQHMATNLKQMEVTNGN
jgi:hypothetical protein